MEIYYLYIYMIHMRSDCKIPEIWTIINDRKYIWWFESRYSWWHKRNYITVKCMKCWLENHIEAKWFWIHWCKCHRLEEKKWTKHWFQSIDNKELHRFYNIYCWIISRCRWTSWKEAKRWYFDKGIKNLWNSFEDFKNDMYESYVDHVKKFWVKDTTIDRIISDWNYCKENCRWATCKEQTDNRKLSS